MVAAVRRVGELERRECREEFERRFAVEVMAEAYLRVYERARSSTRDVVRVAPPAHATPMLQS
jgi:hypothetical protein